MADSFLNKLSRLLRDNALFGGVGVTLTGLGFEWAKAPPIFSIALIVAGWAFITVAIWQGRFFETRSKQKQMIGKASISSFIAIVFVIAWLALVPPQSQIPQEAQSDSALGKLIIAAWYYFKLLAVWLYPFVTGAFIAWFLSARAKKKAEQKINELEAALQREKNRCLMIHTLSAVRGAGVQLERAFDSPLFRDKSSPDESKHLVELWKDGLEGAIANGLGASALTTFREGALPIPDSLEEQRKWIRQAGNKLGELITGILQGESAEMKMIKVRSALEPEPDGGNRVALWEKHEAHPGGEIYIADQTVKEVAETLKVAEAIQDRRLNLS